MDREVKNIIELFLELSHLSDIDLSGIKSEDRIDSWLLAVHSFVFILSKLLLIETLACSWQFSKSYVLCQTCLAQYVSDIFRDDVEKHIILDIKSKG